MWRYWSTSTPCTDYVQAVTSNWNRIQAQPGCREKAWHGNFKQKCIMKKISFVVSVLAALCACTKESANLPSEGGENLVAAENQIVCHAPSVSSKTGTLSTSAPYSVVWLDSDAVKVIGASAPEGVDYIASLDGESASALFTSSGTPVLDENRIAVYPASAVTGREGGAVKISLAKLNRPDYHSTIPNYGKWTNYVPSGTEEWDKAYYEANSIFPHLPLYAKGEGDTFSFTNLTACVSLVVNDYQGNAVSVRSIKLTTDKYISGTMLLNEDGSFTLTGDSDDQKSTTVYAKNAVKLSPADYTAKNSYPKLSNSPSPFYFFLPAGEYNGMSFEITLADGRVVRQATAKQIVLQKGEIRAFPKVQLTLYYGAQNTYQTTPGSTLNVDVRALYSTSDRLVAENKLVEGTLPELRAEVLWELSTGATALAAGSVISSAVLSGDVVTVTVGSNTGNAVLAVKDASDKVLWSYHIWVTEDAPADVLYRNGDDSYYMMDRDLGAVWVPKTDTWSAAKAYKTYGMMYEWGRKDPLPTYGVSTYSTASKALFGQEAIVNSYPVYCLNRPLTRLVGMSGKSDPNAALYPSLINNQILWGVKTEVPITDDNKTLLTVKHSDVVKTVYDPCPEGYMVPQAYHFQALAKAGTINGKNYAQRQGFCAFLNCTGAATGSETASDVTAFNLRGYFAVATTVSAGLEVAGNGTQSNWWTSTPWGTNTWGGAVFQVKGTAISVVTTSLASSAPSSVRCLKIE